MLLLVTKLEVIERSPELYVNQTEYSAAPRVFITPRTRNPRKRASFISYDHSKFKENSTRFILQQAGYDDTENVEWLPTAKVKAILPSFMSITNWWSKSAPVDVYCEYELVVG